MAMIRVCASADLRALTTLLSSSAADNSMVPSINNIPNTILEAVRMRHSSTHAQGVEVYRGRLREHHKAFHTCANAACSAGSVAAKRGTSHFRHRCLMSEKFFKTSIIGEVTLISHNFVSHR